MYADNFGNACRHRRRQLPRPYLRWARVAASNLGMLVVARTLKRTKACDQPFVAGYPLGGLEVKPVGRTRFAESGGALVHRTLHHSIVSQDRRPRFHEVKLSPCRVLANKVTMTLKLMPGNFATKAAKELGDGAGLAPGLGVQDAIQGTPTTHACTRRGHHHHDGGETVEGNATCP